jgi:hypothetical protein
MAVQNVSRVKRRGRRCLSWFRGISAASRHARIRFEEDAHHPRPPTMCPRNCQAIDKGHGRLVPIARICSAAVWSLLQGLHGRKPGFRLCSPSAIASANILSTRFVVQISLISSRSLCMFLSGFVIHGCAEHVQSAILTLPMIALQQAKDPVHFQLLGRIIEPAVTYGSLVHRRLLKSSRSWERVFCSSAPAG